MTVYVFFLAGWLGSKRVRLGERMERNFIKLFLNKIFKHSFFLKKCCFILILNSAPPPLCAKGKLRPAFKKLYQLRPKASASRVTVASRVVNPKHDGLRPAVSKELHQLHRKIGVYKMSNNWKVLTQFYCTLLYTQSCTRTQNC